MNLETLATGDTEADELSLGLPASLLGLRDRQSRFRPPEKPLTQAVLGPGSRMGWAPAGCTIWIPPMGIQGHGALRSSAGSAEAGG